MYSGTISAMPPSSELLYAEIDALKARREAAREALRTAQAEYLEADRVRKRAARSATQLRLGSPTQDEMAAAMGYSDRQGLRAIAGAEGGYTFGPDVLAELAAIAVRYDEAARARRELVLALRGAPKDEALTFAQMGAAMGLSAEGVRYLTRGRKR